MILNFNSGLTNRVNPGPYRNMEESEECPFCFVCLKGLRGWKGQHYYGDGGDEVKGQVGRRRKNHELNSIKILLTYLLNTADNKHDSVLKGILKLAGVMVGSDVDGDEQEEVGEELQNTPTRECISLCDKCEGIAGRILELHLELEKVQMRIVREVKTVREVILRSSGWLGGTGTWTGGEGEGMMNELEEEEAFENFARRFFDGGVSMKARGTFGFLKTFQTAVADIDKTAVHVPLVYLDRYAIPVPQNSESLAGSSYVDSWDRNVVDDRLNDQAEDIDIDPFQDDDDDSSFSLDGEDFYHSNSDSESRNIPNSISAHPPPGPFRLETGTGFLLRSGSRVAPAPPTSPNFLESPEWEELREHEPLMKKRRGRPRKAPKVTITPSGRPPGTKRKYVKKQPPGTHANIGRKRPGPHPDLKLARLPNRTLPCETCKNYKTRSLFRLEQHLRDHETEEKTFHCEQCSLGFSNQQHYTLHQGRHKGNHKLPCEVCHQSIHAFGIVAHMKTHVDQVFPCKYCSHCLPSVERLMIHLRKRHSKVEWKCEMCGKLFQNDPEVMEHLYQEHQAVQKISCGVEGCSRIVYDKDALRRHVKLHGVPLACTQCDKVHSTQEKFAFHQELHRTGKPYKCPYDNCLEAFPNSNSLTRHKARVHQDERRVCEICGKEYKNPSGLYGHRVEVHGLGKGQSCEICNKIFGGPSKLERHMEIMHSTERKYVCEDCGKSFKTMGKCRAHRLIHGERTYQCTHCPMAFRQRPALRDHIRIHTGEKPFLCRRICGKAFRQGSTRNKHESICSGGAGASPSSTQTANEPERQMPSSINTEMIQLDYKPLVLS